MRKEPKSGSSGGRKILKGILIGIGAITLGTGVFLSKYFYDNMNYDDALMKEVFQAGFEEKQLTLENSAILNYVEGPDNGPALLLIHGQEMAWGDYDTVLPELSKSFHVYAVDCFGHGKSEHRADLYTCQSNAEALIAFMKDTIQEPCYVSGHSSGGILAARLAANAPEQVRGLLLEDPPLFRVTPEEVQEGKGAFTWFDTYTISNQFVNQTEEMDYSLYYLRHSYFFSLFGGLHERVIQSAEEYRAKHPNEPIKIIWLPHAWIRPFLYIDNYDPKFGAAFHDGSWMQDIDQEEMLKKIRCPVIYMKAESQYGQDGVLYAANRDEDADRVQRTIADCERIDIRSGHDIHFEHPTAFVTACKKLQHR